MLLLCLSFITNFVFAEERYNVIVDISYPPFSFGDGQNQIIGFNIDLLEEIAKEENFTLNIRSEFWNSAIPSILEKKADILASGVTITDIKDNENIIASIPYFTSHNCIAYLDQTLLDDWQNQRILVDGDDENLAENLHSLFQANNVQTVNTIYLGLRNVAQNQADFLAGDCAVINYYINSPTFTKNNFQFHKEILDEGETTENIDYIFVVHKDNQELIEKINNGLKKLKQNGQIKALLEKWNIETLKNPS